MSNQKQQHEYISRFDRLPLRESLYQKASAAFRNVALFYGFTKISPSLIDSYRAYAPLVKSNLLDETSLILCASGGGEDMILRPSCVLGTLRALAFHNAPETGEPHQVFFEGENYFYDGKNTAPRARSSSQMPALQKRHEMGLMALGEEESAAEAQIIQVIAKTLERLGIVNEDMELRINATGCGECHPQFRSAFIGYFRPRASRLCKDCKNSLKRMPVKILACQEERCRILASHAPQALDFLCESCKKHLKEILEFLDEMQIPYYLDHALFRPGSWFSSLVFEFRKNSAGIGEKEPKNDGEYGDETDNDGAGEVHTLDGAIATRPGKDTHFAEGGRLSVAAELFFGRKMNAVSGSLFFDRLEKAFPRQCAAVEEEKPQVFFAHLGELAKKKSLAILEGLRAADIGVSAQIPRNAIKSQLRAAERMKTPLALVLGQKEALDETIIVREMESGIQETIPQGKLVEFLKKKLKK